MQGEAPSAEAAQAAVPGELSPARHPEPLGPSSRSCRGGYPAGLFLLRYFLHSDFPLQAAQVRGSALAGESDRPAQRELFIEGQGGRGKGCDRHHILLPRGCGWGKHPRTSPSRPAPQSRRQCGCSGESPSTPAPAPLPPVAWGHGVPAGGHRGCEASQRTKPPRQGSGALPFFFRPFFLNESPRHTRIISPSYRSQQVEGDLCPSSTQTGAQDSSR